MNSRKHKFFAVFTLAAMIFTLFSVALAVAEGDSTQANTDGVDEIIVVGTDGYVYAYSAVTGQQIFKSPESGWKLVATADFNGDGDAEIVAVNDNTIKVYDPQVISSTFSFETTYNHTGNFSTVGTGDFWNDGSPDIALIFDAGTTNKHIIIYNLPSTSPAVDKTFLMADNFAIGDYDGDGDDDFALIAWNDSNPTGAKSWFELRKGKTPDQLLDNNNNAGVYNDSQWFDVASGTFDTGNGAKQEWVGAQNLGNNLTVQKWTGSSISTIWTLGTAFNFVAADNFRGDSDNIDQVVMLRNVTSGTNLQFAKNGIVWASISGLGTGWLNLAAGNLDGETTYHEAVAIKSNLIRVYLRPQAGSGGESTYLDCSTADNCFESFALTSSLNGALAVADVGVTFDTIEPFTVSPTNISASPELSQTVPTATFAINGDTAANEPLTWRAYILPYDARVVAYANSIFRTEANLNLTITPRGIEYVRPNNVGVIPTVDWLALSSATGGPDSYITGTTPATVTVTFSDTFAASPLGTAGLHRAIIQVQNMDSLETKSIPVSVFVAGAKLYLPLVIK